MGQKAMAGWKGRAVQKGMVGQKGLSPWQKVAALHMGYQEIHKMFPNFVLDQKYWTTMIVWPLIYSWP